jgi:hypothetical protein
VAPCVARLWVPRTGTAPCGRGWVAGREGRLPGIVGARRGGAADGLGGGVMEPDAFNSSPATKRIEIRGIIVISYGFLLKMSIIIGVVSYTWFYSVLWQDIFLSDAGQNTYFNSVHGPILPMFFGDIE